MTQDLIHQGHTRIFLDGAELRGARSISVSDPGKFQKCISIDADFVMPTEGAHELRVEFPNGQTYERRCEVFEVKPGQRAFRIIPAE